MSNRRRPRPGSRTQVWLLLAVADPDAPLSEQGMVSGSRLVTADCGHWASVSPQSEHLLGVSRTICSRCVGDTDLLSHPNAERYAVPGAVDAMSRHVGEADQARAWLREHGIVEL